MKLTAVLGAFVTLISFISAGVHAQSDVYIRDASNDTGAEPYAGNHPIYLSPDIWVRTSADVNYSPYPFSTSDLVNGLPPWAVFPPGQTVLHENPEYRDSKTGRPNYVYVQIHNRGNAASSGTERLRLYQAKAGTGLSWPAAWVDNMANACGQDLLHGIEVTKPRRNALNVSQAEFDRYTNAVSAISTNPSLRYSDGTQYWQKQQQIHVDLGNPIHGNPGFLPWHREMVNRYEERLKEHDPLVTLLYWDWTQNPATVINRGFIGSANGNFNFGGVALERNIPGDANISFGSCTFDSDATLLSAPYDLYENFNVRLEEGGGPIGGNHNCGHVYIGGMSPNPNPPPNWLIDGEMSSPAVSAQDPFFFMHHTNVDRLWATWQREDADPAKVDTASAYDGETSHATITGTYAPWDGTTATDPWTPMQNTPKNGLDRSILYPPVYDTAPVNIPVLQPGQSVVIEIPWYPPNVNSFNCAGDAGHFCLLARIETQTAAPFGMTVAEGTNLGTNTRNNNNIAWKNLTIVDNEFEPLFFRTGTVVHNFFDVEYWFTIRLVDRTAGRPFFLHEFADLALVLPRDVLERLWQGKYTLQDLEMGEIKGIDQPVLRITGKEPALRLSLKPDERVSVQFVAQLRDDHVHKALLEEPFHFDIEQTLDLPEEFIGLRDKYGAEVGGVRFTLDFNRLQHRQESGDKPFSPANFDIQLRSDLAERLLKLTNTRPEVLHLSPGEPFTLTISQNEGGRDAQMLSVNIGEALRFEEPGVHRVIVEERRDDGTTTRRERRVLVSENIPPQVVISEPGTAVQARVGEELQILANAIPAFGRDIKLVTLHTKEDTSFLTSFNLPRSEDSPAIATAEGQGPYKFTYIPETPGMHMLQLGALDDKGVLGTSEHIMIMVRE